MFFLLPQVEKKKQRLRRDGEAFSLSYLLPFVDVYN